MRKRDKCQHTKKDYKKIKVTERTEKLETEKRLKKLKN